jgi:hypothetical protein
MTISHKRKRAKIGTYDRGGTGGRTDPGFIQQSSAASDGRYWCALMNPTGHEFSPGMTEEHVVDVLAVFGPRVPMTEDGAFEVDGVEYYVRSILPRENGHDDLQVLGQRAERTLVWR